MTRTYLDPDPMKNSWLTLLASDGTTKEVVLPPASTVQFGENQVHVAAGETRVVRWDGPYKVISSATAGAQSEA